MIVKLNSIQKGQLRNLLKIGPNESLWSKVEPHKCDSDLAYFLDNGLVTHLGFGKGYRITNAGRAALERSEG